LTDHNKQNGSRLRQIRERLGETQAVFTEGFGLSKHDVANYERRRCDIPTRIPANLDKMGLNLGWLLNNRGEMFYEGGY